MSPGQRDEGPRKVLVVGIPRSGTTWVGRALGLTTSATYVHEPDNELLRLPAMLAKVGLGRYPVLAPGDRPEAYQRLWEGAFRAGRTRRTVRNRVAHRLFGSTGDPERERALAGDVSVRLRAALALADGSVDPARVEAVVVKSVHAPLALTWLHDRFGPATLVMLRHPFSVLASTLELDLRDGDRGLDRDPRVERMARSLGLPWTSPPPSPLGRIAWQIGLLQGLLERDAERHPAWEVVRHEDLVDEPHRSLASLAERLGLRWSTDADEFLRSSNRPGTRFQTMRVAGEEVGRWRRRLRADQIAEAESVLRAFPSRYDTSADAAAAARDRGDSPR
jgi:Sulfotransferase family